MPLVTTNSSGVPTANVPPNVGPFSTIAAAGSAIGNATAITARMTVVTAADDTKGVVLPSTASPGDVYYVYSAQATNGLKVYPHSGGDINDGSGNAAIVQEGKTMGVYVLLDGTTWGAMYTSNS